MIAAAPSGILYTPKGTMRIGKSGLLIHVYPLFSSFICDGENDRTYLIRNDTDH